MTIDPKWRFIFGLVITFAIGVSSGAVVLTNAIPVDWIKPAIAWCGIIAFVGSAAQTTISGFGMTSQSRLAAAATLPEVKSIVTTQAVADATPSDKVVGPTTGTGTK